MGYISHRKTFFLDAFPKKQSRDLLESVWTMVGKLAVGWRKIRGAMEMGRKREIMSRSVSEKTFQRVSEIVWKYVSTCQQIHFKEG